MHVSGLFTMKFGLILPNYGASASPEDLLKLTVTSEQLGFQSVWTTDHVLLPKEDAARFGRLYEALVTLSWLAGATTRLHLGVSSLVLPQRNPVIVAKQVAALDALSSGRAMVCVGVGWSAGEYRNLGADFKQRGRRIEEAIQVMRTLWSADGEAPVSFDGQFYHFEEGVFSPAPVQRGGPPLWIGGHAQAVLKRAARLADGWHASGASVEQIEQGRRTIHAVTQDAAFTISARLRLSFDDADPGAPLRGPADRVAEHLLAYQQAGLEYAVIDFRVHEPAGQAEAMARFMEQVAPLLQDAPA